MAIWQYTRKARKAKAFTLAFLAQTAGGAASALTWAAADALISKDGGAFANTTNLPTEIGTTGVHTLALTATEMDADTVVVRLVDAGMDVQIEVIETDGETSGAVVADGSNTASTFKTDLTEATNDYWKEAILLFTSGSLAGQVSLVTAYNGTTKFVTLNRALTAAPSASDLFILINR